MPGMGGHAFAVEVGKLPSPPPVLYISAYEKPQGEMAQRFLQKPFSIAELSEAVAPDASGEAGRSQQGQGSRVSSIDGYDPRPPLTLDPRPSRGSPSARGPLAQTVRAADS